MTRAFIRVFCQIYFEKIVNLVALTFKFMPFVVAGKLKRDHRSIGDRFSRRVAVFRRKSREEIYSPFDLIHRRPRGNRFICGISMHTAARGWRPTARTTGTCERATVTLYREIRIGKKRIAAFFPPL